MATLEMASNPPQVSGYKWKAELQNALNICRADITLISQAIRADGERRTHIEAQVAADLARLLDTLHQLREYRE